MKKFVQKETSKFSNFTFKKFIIVFIICLIFATLYVIKYRLSFMGAWDMVLLFIYSPIIIILSVSTDLFISKRINISKYTLAIPIACVFGAIAGNFISKYQADLSKEKVKPIIQGLEQYKVENGKYPNQLYDLIPKYLSNIPNSMMGCLDVPYQYDILKDGNYSISFPFIEEGKYTWTSKGNRWYEGQQ